MQPFCSPSVLCGERHDVVDGSSDLDVELVPADRLSAHHLTAWRAFQQSNPDLVNPLFAPEFVQAVAAVRHDVEVAVFIKDRKPVAFFPFQRRRGRRAVPVGGIVSDYHGLICRPNFACDPQALLKSCGLVAWDFDRLVASQRRFVSFRRLAEPSAQIDLSDGFEAYARARKEAGTQQLRACEYMTRRLQRELGPLRFVAHSDTPELLRQVLDWKSQQYRRSGWNDLFEAEWARSMVERIHRIQTPGFAGMLSLLYAGPFLVAGHMGMRSDTVWHYWFPAYDRRFSKYSPGIVLLLKMAQTAEHLGLRCIDMGTGISLYKRRLMNTSVQVLEGSLERPSCLHFLRSGRRVLSGLAHSMGYRS